MNAAERERTSSAIELKDITNVEKRLIAAMVEIMYGYKNKALDILISLKTTPLITPDIAARYLKKREEYDYSKNQYNTVFYKARLELSNLLNVSPQLEKEYFGSNIDSAMNSLKIKGNEMLYPYLEAADFIQLVISKATKFDKDLSRNIQLYIARTKQSFEASPIDGRIDSRKLTILTHSIKTISNVVSKDVEAYLSMVKYIKENVKIEIRSYVMPDEIPWVTGVLRWFPKRISQRIRIPLELDFEELDQGIAGLTGQQTHDGVKINILYTKKEHVIWHELMHKFSLSTDLEGNPLLPVSVWKMIAQNAGFYGAFIGDALLPIDKLSDDYKKFRNIGYGDWIYQEEDGSLSCYLSKGYYLEKKSDLKYTKK